MRINIISAGTVFLLASLLACSDDSSSPTGTPPPSSEHRKVVQIRDNFFSPKDLVVSVGDTVEWVNLGSAEHTSTSGPGCTADGKWTSALLSNGQKFSVIFDADHVNVTGNIPYFCIPHCALNMKGTITVNP